MNLLWVCLGGALGSGARYLVGLWALDAFGKSFPWGTLLVNVIGCFLMGAAARAGERSGLLSETAFLALTTGVLGGFTTYSAFNLEMFRLVEAGHGKQAILYLAATLAGAAIAGIAGYASVRAAVG